MKNGKFEVGDRVVRVNSIANGRTPIGSLGEVTEYFDDDYCIVNFDIHPKDPITCSHKNLELDVTHGSPLREALK